MKIKFRTDSKLNILGSIQRALALAERKTESNWINFQAKLIGTQFQRTLLLIKSKPNKIENYTILNSLLLFQLGFCFFVFFKVTEINAAHPIK